MICTPEAAGEIADVVAAKPVMLRPTWHDAVYSCRYVLPHGALTLSVKELGSRRATDQYFAALRDHLGQQQAFPDIAQGAFATKHGSFVLRKDTKALLVDASALPAVLGAPPVPRWKIAAGVGIAVLACWTGA